MIKDKGWRPTKIEDFVEAFEKVLENNELDVVILTDDELRIACNDLLEERAQISQSTFEKWKAWKAKDSVEYTKFLRLYKKALINQKRNLFEAVNKWDNNWQSRSWIIERKFSEWNLKQITDNTNKWEIKVKVEWNLTVGKVKEMDQAEIEEKRRALLNNE